MLCALRKWVGLALAFVMGPLLIGVVARECLRLLETVVVAGQGLDERDGRAGRVEDLPATRGIARQPAPHATCPPRRSRRSPAAST
jgi:hypothetical protein